MSEARSARKTLIGSVLTDRMDKTVVVSVQTMTKHPLYGKYIKRNIKYSAHDETNSCGVGDKVLIVETRPISKNKRWRVKEILEKSK